MGDGSRQPYLGGKTGAQGGEKAHHLLHTKYKKLDVYKFEGWGPKGSSLKGNAKGRPFGRPFSRPCRVRNRVICLRVCR